MKNLKKINDLLNLPLNIKIFTLAEKNGGKAMLVGGAVRQLFSNFKLNEKDLDLDFAIDLNISKFSLLAKNQGLSVISKDINYRSITISYKDQFAHITQLRVDVENFGRHAKTVITDSWLEDSKRRDFTINAIYLDKNGIIFDPQGGLKDLKENRLKFIGFANKRIQEDHLRILRAFRIASENKKLVIFPPHLKILKSNLKKLKKISKERVLKEFKKIINSKDMNKTFILFNSLGVDKILFNESFDLKILKQKNYKKIFKYLFFPISLAFLLRKNSRKKFLKNFNLCKTDQKSINAIDCILPKKLILQLMCSKWKRACYWLKEDSKIIYIKCCLEKKLEIDLKKLEVISKFKSPKFAISGRDVEKQYLTSGKSTGKKLKQLEVEWVNNDFTY